MAETSEQDEEAWRQTWPFLPFCDEEVLRKCKAYPASNDIFICSFPKSGTTWMQNMVYTLLTRGEDRSFEQISDVAPFFEHRRTWSASSSAGAPPSLSPKVAGQTAHMDRKVFNTHLLWQLLPTDSPASRFIYVVRQGEDALVSFFHHLSNQVEGGFDGDFASFFADSMAGKVAFGCWTEHLQSFFPQLASQDPRILCVTYEEMKVDLLGVASRVAAHLGLAMSEEEIKPLLELLSFESMKSSKQFQPTSVTWADGFQFIRKGEVGSFKDHFTGSMEADFLSQVQESKVFDLYDPWRHAGALSVQQCGAKYKKAT